MNNTTIKSYKRWSDWAIFAARWILLLAVSLGIFAVYSRPGLPALTYDLFVLPILIILVANVILVAVMFIPQAIQGIPFVIILGDWAIAGGLTYLLTQAIVPFSNLPSVVGVEQVLVVSTGVFMIGLGLLRLGWTLGLLQVIGVAGAIALTLAISSPNPAYFSWSDTFNRYLPALAMGVGGIGVIGFWVYMRDQHTHGQEKRLQDVTRQKEQELAETRERTRVISEMGNLLNSTLNYEKILDAVLDIGLMSTRKDSRNRIVSMVLLYEDSDKEALYIANSRGLSHNDLARSFAGQRGIVAQALEKAVPLVGKDPYKDPELESFVAVQGMKSILSIPLRAGFDNFGVVLYISNLANAFDADRIDALMAISAQATVTLQNALLHRNLMRDKERIIEMEENARKALVRDLHDIPTQTISAVTMRLSIIQKLIERNSPDVLQEVKTVEEMARRSTEEIRHVLFKLRPLALESQGLTAALNELADKLLKTHKQNVAVRIGNDIEHYLNQDSQGVVFYLVEEAVNNARKYAEASLITVKIGRKGNVIVIQIADNGKGFDMAAVAAANQRGSYGMTNMRERAELLDGSLKVESAPNVGTTITVTIPIRDRYVPGTNNTNNGAAVPANSRS